MNAVHRNWRAYALALERATYFARVRVVSQGGRVRYSDAGPVDPPRAAAVAAPCVPAPAPRGPRVAAAPPRGGATLASCMARGTAVRGAPAASRASPAEVVDLDDLEGDYDEEEDGGAADGASSDASVKSEHDEEDESEALLKDLRAAAGGGGVPAASSRDKVSDDPVFLLKAFIPPQMTVKATTTVVKFMFEHVRETLEATGARVAPLGGEDVRKSLQLASVMLVRLAGFLSQAPGELVGAAAMRAGTPMPCKTSVQGGTALKALREIVFEHMTEREVGHAATMGTAGRKSALSSSGILMQKLGVPSARLQMFHVADGGASDKGGPEGLGQGIFKRGLCAISNDAAAREQLGVLVGLLEEGLSDSGVTRKGAKKMTPGCLFVRAVAGLVGNALAKSSSSSTMWAHVFLAEQCGKPSASSRERMQHNPGYEHLDTVWQAVCSGAVLLGARALEVMDPTHTWVIGDEAVHDRLLHEAPLRLAAASLAARRLRLLELLLESLQRRVNVRGRAGVLASSAGHDDLSKALVRLGLREVLPRLGEGRQGTPELAKLPVGVIKPSEHDARQHLDDLRRGDARLQGAHRRRGDELQRERDLWVPEVGERRHQVGQSAKERREDRPDARLWLSPFTTPSQLDVCSDVIAFLRSNFRHRPYQQAFASSVVSRLSRRIRRRHSCCRTCSTPARTTPTGIGFSSVPPTMIDHDEDRGGGDAPRGARLADMQAERWGGHVFDVACEGRANRRARRPASARACRGGRAAWRGGGCA